MRWLEISLLLSGELAEPVADLLSSYTESGASVELGRAVMATNGDAPVTVRAYLVEDEELETKRRKIEEGLWHLSQIRPLPSPNYRWLEARDWEEAWKKDYHPIPIGRKLTIHPSWIPPEKSARTPLILNPGMAFGTGTHPSTQLCLEAIETYLQPEQRVVDIGCGSGILSIAAALFGAPTILALDNDPNAIKATRENAQRNGVIDRITPQQGSLELILDGQFAPYAPAELVVANILFQTLASMIDQGLADIVKPGGILILSGILEDQAPLLSDQCLSKGLQLLEILEQGDWRALVLKRIPPTAM